MPIPLQLDVNPDVVCSPLDGGGVLLDLATKQYFALNSTGLVAWQFLEDGGSLDALAAALDASGVPGAAADLTAFAHTLIDYGLAMQAHGLSQPAIPPPSLPTSWTAPVVTPHGRPLAEVILSPFDPTVPVPE